MTTDDSTGEAGLSRLRLAYEGPYDHAQIFGFLERRAIPGVEEVTGGPGRRTYRRTLRLPHGTGVAEVDEGRGAAGTEGAEDPDGAGLPDGAGERDGAGLPDGTEGAAGPGIGAAPGGWLECRLRLTDPRDLTAAEQLLRRQFDLDADPRAVAELLGADAALGPHVAAAPGLRAPGTVDPHELAVRAVLGQQITVAAARTLAARLVDAHGKPLAVPDGGLTRLFPEADALAAASLAELGMPESRRATIRTVAAALADGTVVLEPGADREARDATERALLALRGIGPWTAGYVRMRALGDPDVFLPGDVGVRHGLARIGADAGRAETWRPWRSYALHHLWHLASQPAATGAAVTAGRRRGGA